MLAVGCSVWLGFDPALSAKLAQSFKEVELQIPKKTWKCKIGLHKFLSHFCGPKTKSRYEMRCIVCGKSKPMKEDK